MAIIFSSPDETVYGCFHPSSHQGFREATRYWPSVEQYMLAHRAASEEDREQLRLAQSLEHARSLADQMVEKPGWTDLFAETLEHAVLRTFESNLRIRATLLSTGNEPIVPRLDDPLYTTDNLLGRILEKVRSAVRLREQDASAIQCEHQEAELTRFACIHLLAERELFRRHHRHFTGQGSRFDALCPSCRAALPAPAPLRKLCSYCFTDLLNGARQPDVGVPEFRRRESDVRYEHHGVRLPGLGPADVFDMVPIPRIPGVWLVLDRAGQLHRVAFADGTVAACARLPPDAVGLTEPVDLHVAPHGQLAAVTESKGCRAVVLDPMTGLVTARIQREDYHPEHCPFPFGFFELSGTLYMVSATNWNRLDVLDPRTGATITVRELPPCQPGEVRPEHFLDYFHAALLVSPSGERIIDNGWIWHPVGVVRTFNLRRWLEQNVWESEDGPSLKDLSERDYYWAGPVCWLEEPQLAIWGEGADDIELTPGVRIWDADTGTELRSFAGPEEGLFYDPPYLVSFGDDGASVWDIATGEQVARDPQLHPLGHHPSSHEFISPVGAEEYRISRRI